MTKSIAFIFTNYNNSIITLNALESIYSNEFHESVSIEVVVVDNNSSLDERDILECGIKKYDTTHVRYLSRNVGYFNGLNEGINSLICSAETYDFVLIGNNDLIFDRDFIGSVYAKIAYFAEYPVISPNIIRLDGFHQNPHVTTPISKLRRLIYDVYFSNYYISRVVLYIANVTAKYTRRDDQKDHTRSSEIIMGYGACYLLGPLFFEKFGSLLAPTFLMGEEFFLSFQLAEKNYRIFYESNIKVHHHDHATISALPTRKFWNYAKESHKIMKKFKGSSDFF